MNTEQLKPAAKALQEREIKSIYLSYPMTHDNEGKSLRKADKIHSVLEDLGFQVINPGVISREVQFRKMQPEYHHYMAADLQALCERADAILMVDEWSGSRGCRCEAFVAYTCGKTMLNEKLEEPADYKSMNFIFGQK